MKLLTYKNKQTEKEQIFCGDFQQAHCKGKNEENKSQAEHSWTSWTTMSKKAHTCFFQQKGNFRKWKLWQGK